MRDRLWFFAGYQYLRDHDSQPGTDPALPRTYEQDKIFAKLTWKFTPGLRLEQSFHDEFGINPDRPTIVTPFEAIARRAHLGAGDDVRPSDARGVGQYRLGCARRPLRLLTGR